MVRCSTRFAVLVVVAAGAAAAGAQPRAVRGDAANGGGPTMELVRFEGPTREDRLRTALEGATRRWRTCWRRDAGSLRGRFELSLITAPDGRVIRARVLSSELRVMRDGAPRAANSTTRCYERAAARLRLHVTGDRTRPLLVRLAFDFGGAAAEPEPAAEPAADPASAPGPQRHPQPHRGPIRLPR